MPATGPQLITPKQLIILKYMFARLKENPPFGWTEIRKMENKIRFDELLPVAPATARQPIGEEIIGTEDGVFPLVARRSDSQEPYLITHRSEKNYRISQAGVNIVQRCALKNTGKFDQQGQPIFEVIDKHTGKWPIIETTSADATHEQLGDAGDDDEDDTPPVVDLAEEPPQVGIEADEDDTGIDEPDQRPPSVAHDEINDAPPPRGARIAPPAQQRTTPSKRPPTTGKQQRTPRKARVPGRD